MTGTAREVAGELWAVYGLRVVARAHPPTRRAGTSARPDAVPTGRREVGRGRCRAAREDCAAGRPVLVGTRSVRRVGGAQRASGARSASTTWCSTPSRTPRRPTIVARAGQPGRVTVATNMAGRGTDIQLARSVAERGGLHVILTEYHESRRIDRQLFGRGARQGDPGSCEALASLDDELFDRFAADARRTLGTLGGAGAESPPWAAAMLRRLAQRRAERAHARVRLATVRQEARMDRMMAFAGRGE